MEQVFFCSVPPFMLTLDYSWVLFLILTLLGFNEAQLMIYFHPSHSFRCSGETDGSGQMRGLKWGWARG